MKTIILSIFGYLLLSNVAVALTIVDMVNEGGKELHAFSVCPAANTIPAATCDEAHLRECKLLDYVDAVGADRKDQKWLQYQYLMYLIRRYRDHGLKEKEAEARARIDALGFPKPEPQQPIDHLQYLFWADQQSEHCLPEHAKATVAQVERAEALKPAGWFEVPARIALSRARLGDRQGALDLIDSLKREFAAPPEAQRKWLRHYLVDRIIVTAAAELGEYNVADRYVASRGYDGDSQGLIAQIAVRRGDLDGADHLLISGDVKLQLGQGWGYAMAYLALTHSYVLRRDFNSAVRVAERWNSRLAKEGGDVVKSLPRILPHRLIALEMAKRDPIAAMKYVRAHDPAEAPVCSSSLANVGARAGFAEEALQILKSNELQPRPVNRGKPSRPWGKTSRCGSCGGQCPPMNYGWQRHQYGLRRW